MIVIVKMNWIFAKEKFSILDVGRNSISADDDIYQTIAKSYVNRISDTNQYCNFQNDDVGTIIHGADWYEVAGGMQDYGYLNYGTIEMTMEISCCKYPTDNLLISYWNYNRDAMIDLLFQAQRGLDFFENLIFLEKFFVQE